MLEESLVFNYWAIFPLGRGEGTPDGLIWVGKLKPIMMAWLETETHGKGQIVLRKTLNYVRRLGQTPVFLRKSWWPNGDLEILMPYNQILGSLLCGAVMPPSGLHRSSCPNSVQTVSLAGPTFQQL